MRMIDAVELPPSLSLGCKRVVVINDIAFGGEGVARIDDFVVFVPFVIVGEEVEIEITEVKKRFARGRLTQVLAASPARGQPSCPYFGDCGGGPHHYIAHYAHTYGST